MGAAVAAASSIIVTNLIHVLIARHYMGIDTTPIGTPVIDPTALRWVALGDSYSAGVGVDGGVYGLVCPTRGPCTAVGSYLKGASNYAGFTVSTR